MTAINGPVWWSFVLVFIASLIGGIVPLLLKEASRNISFSIKWFFNKWLWFGGSLFIISTTMFAFALKGGELSILYPLVSASYVFSAIFARIFLKEKISNAKIAGIFLIIIGVALIAFET